MVVRWAGWMVEKTAVQMVQLMAASLVELWVES
jgi:hypothetical protein